MSLPKEPRQKMINMMYLVLTAMLALNVSSEILNAFKTVDKSLVNANVTIDEKNNQIFQSFEQKLKNQETAERAAKWKPKADIVRDLSDEIIKYIDGLKRELKEEAGLKVTDKGEEYKEDNLEASTRMFVEGTKQKGKELKDKLAEYKKKLLSIDPLIAKEFDHILPIDLSVPETQSSTNDTWEYAYFHMAPTVAAITILSKFQNDVKNSEAMVLDYCHKQVGQVEVVYDAFQAFVGTNSQYLMPGDDLVVSAGVGAFSKASLPSITIDGASVSLNASGVAESKTKVSGPGTYSKKVSVTFRKPDGTQETLTKDVQYTVGSPTGLSVSADRVKVLYVGLENDLTISGGAKGAESISASINNGSLEKKGNGRYVAHVAKHGTATVTVNTTDGKSQQFEFRVRTVPPPVAKIGISAGGTMTANEMKGQQGVRADLENFVFEGVKFEVTGFLLICTGKGFETGPAVVDNNGAYFSAAAKEALERCKAGSTVVVDRIRVTGPGGSQVLRPTVFNLKG